MQQSTDNKVKGWLDFITQKSYWHYFSKDCKVINFNLFYKSKEILTLLFKQQNFTNEKAQYENSFQQQIEEENKIFRTLVRQCIIDILKDKKTKYVLVDIEITNSQRDPVIFDQGDRRRGGQVFVIILKMQPIDCQYQYEEMFTIMLQQLIKNSLLYSNLDYKNIYPKDSNINAQPYQNLIKILVDKNQSYHLDFLDFFFMKNQSLRMITDIYFNPQKKQIQFVQEVLQKEFELYHQQPGPQPGPQPEPQPGPYPEPQPGPQPQPKPSPYQPNPQDKSYSEFFVKILKDFFPEKEFDMNQDIKKKVDGFITIKSDGNIEEKFKQQVNTLIKQRNPHNIIKFISSMYFRMNIKDFDRVKQDFISQVCNPTLKSLQDQNMIKFLSEFVDPKKTHNYIISHRKFHYEGKYFVNFYRNINIYLKKNLREQYREVEIYEDSLACSFRDFVSQSNIYDILFQRLNIQNLLQKFKITELDQINDIKPEGEIDSDTTLIQLCIVLDATYSMHPVFKTVVDYLASITQQLDDEFGNIEVCYIAYTDVKAEIQGKTALKLTEDFTDIQDLKQKNLDLQQVLDPKNNVPQDIPEDILHGLLLSTTLKWNKYQRKLIMLISDSCDHQSFYKSLPNEDSNKKQRIETYNQYIKLTEEKSFIYQILQYMNTKIGKFNLVHVLAQDKNYQQQIHPMLHQGIQLFTNEINKYQLENSNQFNFFDVMPTHDFKKVVGLIIKTSLSTLQLTQSLNVNNNQGFNKLIQNIITADQVKQKYEKKVFVGELDLNQLFEQKKDDIKRKNYDKVTVKLSVGNEIGSGAYKVCFKAELQFLYDSIQNQDISFKCVVKVPYNTSEDQINQFIQQELEENKIVLQLQRKFNKSVEQKIGLKRNLFFNNMFRFQEQKSGQQIIVEPILNQTYEKFTDVQGIQETDETLYQYLLQAFQHFSYYESQGNLIITDLQGTKVMLTDPKVSQNQKCKYVARKFFKNHQCNYICNQLGLTTPRLIGLEKQPDTDIKYIEETKKKIDQYSKYIHNERCGNQICGNLYLFGYQIKDKYELCQDCENMFQKLKQNLGSITCSRPHIFKKDIEDMLIKDYLVQRIPINDYINKVCSLHLKMNKLVTDMNKGDL